MENTINKKTEHYVCLGGCKGVSPVPGVCQAPDCASHNHDLVKCTCTDGNHYNFDKSKFNSQALWFKRKTYGWGWYPCSWEGWLVTVIYIIIIFSILMIAHPQRYGDNDISYLIPVFVMSIIFGIICYIKGEKPKWQWGGK